MVDVGKELQAAFDDGYAEGFAKASEWISVKDALPEKEGDYLCFYDFWGSKCIEIFKFIFDLSQRYEFDGMEEKRGFIAYLGDGDYYIERNVTHWMPLPKPPKGE